jgi:hypothetical protein
MSNRLQTYKPPIQLKLAALWTATMFCYVYGDYFGLYIAGNLAKMNLAIMGPLGPATPGVLVAVSLMMAVPSVMIFLSLVVPSGLCRWLNIALGLAFTGIMAVSLPGSALFYVVLAGVEMALTLTIAITAWRWPRIPDEA